MNIALMIGGLVCIAVGMWGRKFGAADVEGFRINDNKEVPTWSGKLIFAVVGIGFLIIRILKLLGHG